MNLHKIKIYQYNSYKDFINSLIENSPNKGRGLYRKIATHLNISSVTVSQIFKGSRELNLEQGYLLAEFCNLNELQQKYFLLMIQKEKASHYKLKNYLDKEMNLLKKELVEIKNKVPKNKTLSEIQKSIFYSHWKYSGVRLMTDIEGKNNINEIAKELKLSPKIVKSVLEFLIDAGLVLETTNGFKMGERVTHLPSDSMWLRSHHRNWRTKALDGLENLDENEVSYTGPMVVSEKILSQIKEKLIDVIEEITPLIKDSKSEKLACLNIDLFKLNK